MQRWPLYLLVCAVVIGLQTLFYAYAHVKFADFYVALIGPPLAGAVVMVFAGADATGTLPQSAQRWGRILERAWAIVVIDVAISLAQTSGFETMQAGATDPTALFTGILLTFLAAMLVYAEPYVCLESEVRTLTLVPFALLRSLMLSWVNMSRIFSLFAIQLAATLVIMLLREGAIRLGVHNAEIWVSIPAVTLITAPLAALFTVAYLDTLAQEQRTLE